MKIPLVVHNLLVVYYNEFKLVVRKHELLHAFP